MRFMVVAINGEIASIVSVRRSIIAEPSQTALLVFS